MTSRKNLGIREWDGMFMSEFRRRMRRSKERTWNDGMIADYAIAQSNFLPPPNG